MVTFSTTRVTSAIVSPAAARIAACFAYAVRACSPMPPTTSGLPLAASYADPECPELIAWPSSSRPSENV